MDEFALIRQHFAALAAPFPGALDLRDDAAIIEVSAGKQLVVSTDTMVAGVHFFGGEDAAQIARKLLRVNLSDLAAMGAAPYCYLLNVSLPNAVKESWVQRFCEGLYQDQQDYGIVLAGGDTTATPGPLTLTVTAMGCVAKGKALKRSGAKPGMRVYVSGTLGDSALGLAILKKEINGGTAMDDAQLIERYFLPQPRLTLGQALVGNAAACMDISDGLVQDAGHIAAAAGVGIVLDAGRLPLSNAAHATLERCPELFPRIYSGGDDYELLFTAPPAYEAEIMAIANRVDIPVFCIGEVVSGQGVQLRDMDGQDITPRKQGWQHFT